MKQDCTDCGSSAIKHERGFSGWDFYLICQNCGNIDHYAVNDMQAQEGLGDPYRLIESGKEAILKFSINEKCIELEKAEEGWKNENGQIYAKYDRIVHTAKNLLNVK